MAKRIVKKTFIEGYCKFTLYIVETNRLFGFIPTKWRIATYVEETDELFAVPVRRKAVFSSLPNACNFVGGEITEIVTQEINVEV